MYRYGYGIDYQYMIYLLPALILAMYAQFKISRAYEKYSKVDSKSGLTGAQAARIIMDRNGLKDVDIKVISGKLSDNYDPSTKVLNLSSNVYSGSSVASLGVAAHEVGHALQDQENYAPLKLRALLVPAATIGSNLSMAFILMGLFFSAFFLKLGIALFSIAVLFQIVTLPVEFDASRRAQGELAQGILQEEGLKGSGEVLRAAALTYIAATLVAIAQLIRLISIGRQRD
ncbi:MAG: zinc metallopeptidase [Peptoniphilaceae bacterium]